MATPTGDNVSGTAQEEVMNDSDRIIDEAIRAIIDATINPMHASNVVKLLKENLSELTATTATTATITIHKAIRTTTTKTMH